MKSQICKNKEKLWEYIEAYSNKPVDLDNSKRLNEYMGAYMALCMICGEDKAEAAERARMGDKPAHTPELDGDTEFERVIMSIPTEREYMIEVAKIFANHMESLAAVNNGAYNRIISRLKEVAKR